jgi:predicted ester cyclase
MTSTANESRKFMQHYLQAISGHTKTKALIERFVSDPALIEHIEAVEAAFPGYELLSDRLVVEGELVALQGTFRGRHLGAFAGFEPTGKTVAAGLMIFYRLGNGRIEEHWMQFDNAGLIAQLTDAAAQKAAPRSVEMAAELV